MPGLETVPPISDTSPKTPIGMGGVNDGSKGQINGGNPNLTKNPPSLPGGLPGGAPGAGGTQVTPEIQLNIDSLDTLYLDYMSGVSDGKVEPKNVEQAWSYLQDKSWTEHRLRELMLQFEHESLPKFLLYVINKDYKDDDKVQMSSQPGVGVAAKEINHNVRSGNFMGSKVVINNGTLELVDDNKIATSSIDRLVKASFKLEQSIKELDAAKIKKAGIMALRFKKAAEDEEGKDLEGGEGADEDLDLEGMDDLGLEDDDMGGDPVMDKLDEIIDLLKEIKDAVKGAEDEFDSFEGQDAINASTAIAKAKDAIKLAVAAVKTAKEEEKKGFPFFGKKDKKEDDKDDKKKDKKEDKKEKDKEASVDDVIDQITSKLAELRGVSKEDVLKEAQLYPFKDNKEYKVDGNPVHMVDHKDTRASGNRRETIISDLSKKASAMDPAPSGSELKSEDIDTGYDVNVPGKSEEPYSQEGKTYSAAEVGKIRQSDIKNTVDKARLSFELAAQQQFKGLLACPLKEAMVNEMVNAGIEKQAAEDIAHNAFIDGYEKNQSIILAELNTFMKKDINDFIKVARYTQEFKTKEAGVSVVEDADVKKEASQSQEDETTKTASLRPSQVGNVEDQFTSYWQDVASKNRRW